LGSVRDLTAFALFWPDSGVLMVWTWCPGDNLAAREETDRVPYIVWAERGYIPPTPGRATDKKAVALKLAELCATFKPQAIAFDRYGITELERILNEEGIELPLRAYGQGYRSMSPATKAFEERVLNGRIINPSNPVLTWALSNVAIEQDAAGNIKPSKERSRERIDPIVAAVMAVGIAAQEPAPLVYDFDRPLVLSV
jgi:phage terminase large subunit-like protein